MIRVLAADPDPLVRAAALAAFGPLGAEGQAAPGAVGEAVPAQRRARTAVPATGDDIALLIHALSDTARQGRVGAARGMADAAPEVAVPALAAALDDPHLDVREAAMLTPGTRPDRDDTQEALARAVHDTDADVRAYARRAARLLPR